MNSYKKRKIVLNHRVYDRCTTIATNVPCSTYFSSHDDAACVQSPHIKWVGTEAVKRGRL